MRKLSTILVTGGAGFIGSAFIRHLFAKTDFSGTVVNLDKLTYAGNPANLADVEARFGGGRYRFERADIADFAAVRGLLASYGVDTIVHFAAETHVDRSVFGPREFVESNVVGTFSLLEAARESWRDRDDVLFHHVSTDEVFGSLGETGFFTEESPYAPRSPYSATKAASDHLVRAWFHTYGLPVTLSNCSNNYGPYQFPEKVLPLVILNLLEGKPLPVYGDGRQVRDWLHVEDHVRGLELILRGGKAGETYVMGGANEWRNIDLVERLCEIAASLDGRDREHYKRLITFVRDRPGHDRRYAIRSDKIRNELGWKPAIGFPEGLEATMLWYRSHPDWVAGIRTGDYRRWIETNYSGRGSAPSI